MSSLKWVTRILRLRSPSRSPWVCPAAAYRSSQQSRRIGAWPVVIRVKRSGPSFPACRALAWFHFVRRGYVEGMTIPTTPEPEPGAPEPVPQPELDGRRMN